MRLSSTTRTRPSMPSSSEVSEVVDADLGRALRRLSSLDREVLTLTIWDGLTPEEVGRILEVPAGTVRVRLYRARARLRRLLQPTVAVEAALVSSAGGRN